VNVLRLDNRRIGVRFAVQERFSLLQGSKPAPGRTKTPVGFFGIKRPEIEPDH